MAFIDVNKSKCDANGFCVKVCAFDAITVVNGKAVIDGNRCTLCQACIKACPRNALSLNKLEKNVDLSGYKGIWVVMEAFEGDIKNTAFQLACKARKLALESKDSVTALLVGNIKLNENEIKPIFAEYGVEKVKYLYHSSWTRFIPEDAVMAIAERIEAEKPRVVLFLGTVFGRTIAPQVATRVKTGITADCTELEIDVKGNLLQIRPTYGGKVLATINTPYSRPQIASVRPNIFIEEKSPIPVSRVSYEVYEAKKRSAIGHNEIKRLLKIEPSSGELETPVDEAKIVFVAGLGVGSKEGFNKVESFAREMGAVIAATRAVVDEGWADISQQVGQTGVTIRPELYVGFGVSGAIHHIIGMKNSRKIIAINKDPRAPIFKVADYCVVSDLFEAIEKIRNKTICCEG